MFIYYIIHLDIILEYNIFLLIINNYSNWKSGLKNLQKKQHILYYNKEDKTILLFQHHVITGMFFEVAVYMRIIDNFMSSETPPIMLLEGNWTEWATDAGF